MSSHALDSYDIRLLSALQQVDDTSLHNLAELVSLSASQCSRRISRLKASGYIDKQVTLLNPEAVGLEIAAFVTVSLENHTPQLATDFKESIHCMLAVVECHAITGGDGDYLLKVVAKNQQALAAFLMDELMQAPGVKQIKTALALSAVKSTTALPLTL